MRTAGQTRIALGIGLNRHLVGRSLTGDYFIQGRVVCTPSGRQVARKASYVLRELTVPSGDTTSRPPWVRPGKTCQRDFVVVKVRIYLGNPGVRPIGAILGAVSVRRGPAAGCAPRRLPWGLMPRIHRNDGKFYALNE
jgi:hypothetical protein